MYPFLHTDMQILISAGYQYIEKEGGSPPSSVQAIMPSVIRLFAIYLLVPFIRISTLLLPVYLQCNPKTQKKTPKILSESLMSFCHLSG